MEKQINIPEFDTLQAMAEFWDTHDITDFEDQLKSKMKGETDDFEPL